MEALSDKIIESGIIKPAIKVEDFKEFINELHILDIEHMTNEGFREFIDKKVGKQLSEGGE